MLDFALIRRRLGQYGAVWLIAFGLVLTGLLAGPWLTATPLVRLADLALPLAFAGLGLTLLAFLLVTLLSPGSLATRLALVLLAVVLVLPLLWAPVSGAVVAAWIGDVSIEYSTAYARFRVLVSQLLFGLTRLVFGGALIETVWAVFQGLATVVGFFSALAQIWPIARRLLGREASAA